MKQTDIFHTVGTRATAHICERLANSKDPNRVSPFKDWKEVELYDFVKDAVDGKIVSYDIKDNNINLRCDPETEKIFKNKKWPSIVFPFGSFYYEEKDSAAKNDLFFDVTQDRVYGFALLNVHSADIDLQIGDHEHFLIRYNENTGNTDIGWRIRMNYIQRIFQPMGFAVQQNGGYLHMRYRKRELTTQANDVVQEALRGLASTTHLNITFENSPELVDKAVDAYQSGITNVHHHIDPPKPRTGKHRGSLIDLGDISFDDTK